MVVLPVATAMRSGWGAVICDDDDGVELRNESHRMIVCWRDNVLRIIVNVELISRTGDTR
jgi:hypothetical protein